MEGEQIARISAAAHRRFEQSRLARLPVKARIILGLFLFAAVLTALHTFLSSKDASMHLKVQHGFRSADFSLWIDGDLAYSGKLQGSLKRRFGLIPESVQGSLSEVVPISAGTHQIRVQVESEDGFTQQDSVSGDFARNTERELYVSARPSGLSLAWQATHTSGPSSGSSWFARYAGALLLSIVGPIISTLVGLVLKELPAYLRTHHEDERKAESTVATP